jgi:hypothetical protein
MFSLIRVIFPCNEAGALLGKAVRSFSVSSGNEESMVDPRIQAYKLLY